MSRIALCWIVLLTFSTALAAEDADRQGRQVDARQFFTKTDSDPLVIEVPAPKILVFDAAGGDFVLAGREFTIRADIVELRGDVVLRSHASDIAPATPAAADAGAAGMPGLPGKDAAKIELAIGELRPIDGATWNVINEGTQGGVGGRGGDGPTGSDGRAGSHRRCGRHAKAPGNGAPGGPGGSGGAGGTGGAGGVGADIFLSPNLCNGPHSKTLTFSTQGGRGGVGGEGGAPGLGGAGGTGGFAAWCGPAGSDGADGPDGAVGAGGSSGADGENGHVLLLGGASCTT